MGYSESNRHQGCKNIKMGGNQLENSNTNEGY